uniref:ATPase family AAA domain-containing protein 1-A isoform X3 n=1 Tax=Elaeis guineensis var. tenera TaxID=51953 RepID=A0A8N4F685_ELAGV|nr:ATPase family AAA domain-containing protein 1-A isoform X3 [Elaeis guineensis]
MAAAMISRLMSRVRLTRPSPFLDPASRNFAHRPHYLFPLQGHCWPLFEHRHHQQTLSRTGFKSSSEPPFWFSSLFPAAFLAGAFGIGSLEMSYADGSEDGPKPLAASDSLPSFGGTESLVDQERQRIEEMLRSMGMPRGSYPPFSVAAKGQKVIVKFKIPPTCVISHLIVDLVTHLGHKAEQNGNGSEMLLRAWDREIEDTILLALQSPEVYDDIARGTRSKFESNRPHAVLFEGPPGTGKTSSARVIAKQAGVPLLYVPLEVIMSKYYGESERLLGNVFSLANELPNGAIVFLDEVDSFAVARDSEMHEATRRILSVILRQIDGFEQEKRVVVIAATNRKQDLDPALISRFDSMISFGLPDQQTREEISAQYAKHLKKSELVQLASATEEMSGRDIRDVCQQAERHWASKVIRGQAPKDVERGINLPPIEEYLRCAEQRREALSAIAERSSRSPWKPLALA